MHFEPIKDTIGRYLGESGAARKCFYFILSMVFLRAWHLRKELGRIRKRMPEDSTVLDAGSGLGQHSWYMARTNPGWRISGVDVISGQVDGCNKFFENEGMADRVSFRTADLTQAGEEGKYNLILSVDVMEHIEDDTRVFRNFHSALKQGGRLVITTPSDKGGSGTSGNSHKSFIDEHVRAGYSEGEITAKLAGAGFRDINVKYTYGFPGHIAWKLLIKYPATLFQLSAFTIPFIVPYYILILPFALILNTFDLAIRQKKGTGLLVTAYKQ